MSSFRDPERDSPGRQEPPEALEELFITVFEMADEVTSGIGQEKVEARLRQTVREAADQAPALAATSDSVSLGDKVAEDIGRGRIELEQSRSTRIRRKPALPLGPARHPPLVATAGGNAAAQAVPAESEWGVPPSILGARGGGSAAQRLVLGRHLRQLRESRGITAEMAAEAIRCSYSKIGRMEHGRAGLKEREVTDLLTLYGVTDEQERAALLGLANTTRRPGWWRIYSDTSFSWEDPYAVLEAAAANIQICQNQLIPGLLHTQGYARAFFQAAFPGNEEAVARHLKLQMSRQEILQGPYTPPLCVVLDEAALRRRLGSEEVMRGQLRHLMELLDHPWMTLQILPYSESARLAMCGSFTILRFAEPELPHVVHIGELTGELYLENPAEVDEYITRLSEMQLQAKPASQSGRLLGRILADI